MDTKVKVKDSIEGIATVTVQNLTYPVIPNSPDVPSADPGKEYAVAKVEVCSGSSGSQNGINDVAFTLGFANGETAAESLFPVETPGIQNVEALGANVCATGYVSFEIARGTTPSYVGYESDLIHQVRWRTSSS